MKRTTDTDTFKTILENATRDIETADDNIKINAVVESLIAELIDSEFASLWIYVDDEAVLRRERSNDYVREISMLGQHGILAKTFLTLTPGIYNYLASEKEYLPAVDNPDEIRMKSKILLPLVDGERFLGIVTAYNSIRHPRNFDQNDMEMLEALMPFLVDVVYRMCPQKRETNNEPLYISERMKEHSVEASEKLADIEKEHQQEIPPDQSLTLLANTVHDIRTPANALFGFLELLEGQIEQPRLLQYIQNAKESARFINELTTSILDSVSSSYHQENSKTQRIAPVRFLADIAETFSANMYGKQLQYHIYIDPLTPREITVDAVKLKRVVMNLLGNAYKFTPAKKSVTFSAAYNAKTKTLDISVIDTGIGIAKEHQEKIFEAFAQAEDDTADKYGGTGLGLAISAQYVHDLGGKLQLQSELDKGSRFYFSLPLHIDNTEPTFAPVSSEQTHVSILLDEENLNAAKNLMRYLLRIGIPKASITAVKTIVHVPAKTTQLIVFERKYQTSVEAFVQQSGVHLLVVEETFMAMTGDDFNIAAQYGYYADRLHALFSAKTAARVLIADDDPINIELMRAILEEEFCQIETVADGIDALKMLQEAIETDQPFRVAFLDKHMPSLSGDDVLRQLRAFEKQRECKPLYAVSISGDPKQSLENIRHYDAIVGKPFNKHEIKTTLQRALN